MLAEILLETKVRHMVMIPTMMGPAVDSNGVREGEREGFEVSGEPKRDPGRCKPPVNPSLVDDC